MNKFLGAVSGLAILLGASSALAAYTPNPTNDMVKVTSKGQYHDVLMSTEVNATANAISPVVAGTIDNEVIGGTTPLAGTFTTLRANTAVKLGANLLFSATAPTIASGFGTSPAISAPNGTAAFAITVGTSNAGSGVITLPTATTGWVCVAQDITTSSATVTSTKQTAKSTTSCTIAGFDDAGAAHAWVDADVLLVTATPY